MVYWETAHTVPDQPHACAAVQRERQTARTMPVVESFDSFQRFRVFKEPFAVRNRAERQTQTYPHIVGLQSLFDQILVSSPFLHENR
jgi:hypothetical protein